MATSLTGRAGAAGSGQLSKISVDPYHDADAQHRTQVEPSTFTFGSTVVAAFQSGRIFNGGASNIGFATSTDRGQTWRHGFLPGTTVHASPKGGYSATSDASVAYDARHHVWLISYLGIRDAVNGPVDVLVSRSTDGGLTWKTPVVVFSNGDFLDKNWTVCDDHPASVFYGNCYTEFDDNSLGDLIVLSPSTDSGLHWASPAATPDGSAGLGGQPVVRPNGTVVVPYLQLNDPTTTSLNISAFSSHDGGVTLTRSTAVSAAVSHIPAGNLRAADALPSAQVDGAGRVYVVWQDCRFEASCATNDLLLSTSSNGTNWSVARRIPIDPVGSGVDHFLPGLGVDQADSGGNVDLGLSYYYYPHANCTQATCQLDVGFISSINSGASWSAKQFVAGPDETHLARQHVPRTDGRRLLRHRHQPEPRHC